MVPKTLIFTGNEGINHPSWNLVIGENEATFLPEFTDFFSVIGEYFADYGGLIIFKAIKLGEIMGEMSFIDSAPPSATVQAVEASVVLAIPRKRLSAKLADDIGFAARFYRALSVLLANRLRTIVASAPNGATPDLDRGSATEEMDDVEMASARFDWIQQRLRSA